MAPTSTTVLLPLNREPSYWTLKSSLLALFTSFIYHFLRQQLVYAFYLFLAFLYDIRKRERGAPQRYDAFVSYSIEDEAWVYREMLVVLEEEQGWKLCQQR